MADYPQDPIFGNHPDRYERLSRPFPSEDAANQALEAFAQEVAAAREKHKIPDVAVIARVTIADAEAPGSKVSAQAFTHFGDPSNLLPMLAQEFGRQQAAHEALIQRIIADGRAMGRQSPSRRRGG